MNAVLYLKENRVKRVVTSIGVHGYVYNPKENGVTNYRPTKYISPIGYTTNKSATKVNPIEYIDGYITIIDNDNRDSVKRTIVNFIKCIIDKYNITTDKEETPKLYVYGTHVVTGAINNNTDDKGVLFSYKEVIKTTILKDTTDFGMDNAYLCSIIGVNNYGNTGKETTHVLYTENRKEYFKPSIERHFMLHHNQVYYRDDTNKHTHILYGYKEEFTVGKPMGEAYYGIAYLKEEIPEIMELREMSKEIQGEFSNYITIKLRVLYSNRFMRLYQLFGKDVYKYVVDYPDKRDKSRRLYGIEMLNELVVISITPPGLIVTAFKQLEVLDTVHTLLDIKKSKDNVVLKYKYIDITEYFLKSKKDKKDRVTYIFNRDLEGVHIPVKYKGYEFKPYIQIGVDILSKNNLGRAYKCKLLNVYLVVEYIGKKMFRYYTIVRADNESIVQCNYYSSLLYVK